MAASIFSTADNMLQSAKFLYKGFGDQMPDWLAWTAEEAAEKTGYNTEYIRRLCRQEPSPIEYIKIGRVLLIKAESMMAYVQEMSDRNDNRTGPKPR